MYSSEASQQSDRVGSGRVTFHRTEREVSVKTQLMVQMGLSLTVRSCFQRRKSYDAFDMDVN